MHGAPRSLGELNGWLSSRFDRTIGGLRQGAFGTAGLLALLAALVALFSLFMPATFPRATTLEAMMFQIPELGLLSLSMAFPLISGGINLAIIATANQAALLMAWILTGVMHHDASGLTLAFWLVGALAAGLLSCIVVDLVTGVLVAVLGVHPILVTLGTMTLLRGFSIDFTRGRTLSGFPDALTAISNRTVWGVPISFVLFAIVTLAADVLLTRTRLGVCIHTIGSNLESTRYSGVDTRPGAGLGLPHIERSMLAGRSHNDGPLQFGGRHGRDLRHRHSLRSRRGPKSRPSSPVGRDSHRALALVSRSLTARPRSLRR